MVDKPAVRLERPTARRQAEFIAAVRRSRMLHRHWLAAPRTPDQFRELLNRMRRRSQKGYWVCTAAGELAGVIHLSEIVRGAFQSAYLGYYAFLPHAGRGYMAAGLRAVLDDAFGPLGLHRLEANIQPGNDASRRLVKRCGFRQEGFSPRYLKIDGRWRDHERWAITAEDWQARA